MIRNSKLFGRMFAATSGVIFSVYLSTSLLKAEKISIISDKMESNDLRISVKMEYLVKKLQNNLVSAVEELEAESGSNMKFFRDKWEREQGSYGVSAVL
jgi:hypothetical protein